MYVPDLSPQDRVTLPDGEAHHLTRVLRLREGDIVRVFDGRGREWNARLVPSPRRGAVTIEIADEITPPPEPKTRVTLAAGILKGDHMDAVVRDATMMGATEIVPLVTAHVTVPAKAWQGSRAHDRWHRVAVASAKQCGRAVIPTIHEPASLRSLLEQHQASHVVAFVEPSVQDGAVDVAGLPPSGNDRLLVLVGPEGGWAPEEVQWMRECGGVLAHLGPRTIRADAMATAALSALRTRFE